MALSVALFCLSRQNAAVLPFQKKYIGIDVVIVGEPRDVFFADLVAAGEYVCDLRTGFRLLARFLPMVNPCRSEIRDGH